MEGIKTVVRSQRLFELDRARRESQTKLSLEKFFSSFNRLQAVDRPVYSVQRRYSNDQFGKLKI